MVATRDVIKAPESQGNGALVSRLLTAVVAVDDGDWIDTLGYSPHSFEITGITIGTVQIRGSNAPTKPANTVHGFQIGADVTVAGSQLVVNQDPIRWVKARVSAWTSGTISVDMVAEGND